MPAMNTTQFDWVKNRMPNNPQPVPPIFEPELAAEVVVAAGLARQPRREYWVGSPTVMAIVGQKFIPGLLDWYLGKTGYKSQQIPNDPKDPNAPDNLYNYVPGVHSARGKFTDRSSTTSAEIFASLHLSAVALECRRGAHHYRRRSHCETEAFVNPSCSSQLTPLLKDDRLVIGSCCVALATLVPVALYQTGILPRLPDPPLRVFDSSESLRQPPLILSEFPMDCWASRASGRRSLWPFLPGATRQRSSCSAQS